ncbi:tRNA(Ile)-lysidine synthase [Spinactinospora alkalitolerans]|uniref:tRNA(Ile)-lysidine synthase n=1 Tax=Spinactinospora alkalitolerans TaxID=687207 RepID=A0A852TZG5_9ACTN|nr:tRNA lysidine(34) synthetase TilS [Spinactinospora alkalitolerans]NYE49966.1 tRNA(Ile)-lysidine synthase [Spinactinospora alkalitolerans]
MTGPPPAVAAVRVAVRRALGGLDAGDLVLVACSGGPDSLALAGAAAFVAPRMGLRVGGVTVDHGLQEGSAERAREVAAVLRGLGLDPVEEVAVAVPRSGGPEGAARTARYAALERIADAHRSAAVLLGHTRDDQAETVLLGLARGSGARSLAGMAPRAGRYLRPLLDLDRATVHAAAGLMGFEPWRDPHNADPAYTRSRVRHDALPALERVLGPGIAEALARTAALLRDDADALDAWANQIEEGRGASPLRAVAGDGREEGRGAPPLKAAAGDGKGADDPGHPGHPGHPGDPGGLDAGALAELPRAVRTRILRRAALAAGCPAGALTARHVAELDRLVTEWRGQAHVDLPGGRRGRRVGGRITVSAGGERTGG